MASRGTGSDANRSSNVSSLGGGVWSFGWNSNGQLGHRELRNSVQLEVLPKFIEVFPNSDVIQIAASSSHSLFLTADHQIYSCGSGSFGRLGHGNKDDHRVPKKIEALARLTVLQISCGPDHSAAVTSDGEVWTWGSGFSGRLGNEDGRTTTVPKTVGKLKGKPIAQVSCGGASTAIVTTEGELYTFGYNEYGQLGLGKDADLPREENGVVKKFDRLPKQVKALSGRRVMKVACGGRHMGVLCDEGSMFVWGSNEYGQLGLGLNLSANLDLPTQLFIDPHYTTASSVVPIVDFSCGDSHTGIVLNDGKVYTFGKSQFGRLGYEVNPKMTWAYKQMYEEGNESNRGKSGLKGDPQKTPRLVEALLGTHIVQISCGEAHTAVVTREGKLYVFGWDKYGQLGLGRSDNDQGSQSDEETDESANNALSDIYSLPTMLQSICSANQVSCGGYHTIVLIQGETQQLLQHSIDGNQQAIEQLISNRRNPSQYASFLDAAKDNFNGYGVLHYAALMNHPELINFFKNHNAKLNQKDLSGKTPLHLACEKGHFQCALNLISSPVPGNQASNTGSEIDNLGNTPLHLAARHKHFKLALELVKINSLPLDAKNADGDTLLDLISFEEGFQFKVAAQKHDVVICYVISDYSLAGQLFKAIESYHIKCWLPKPNQTTGDKKLIEQQITQGKGVVIICSERAAADADWMNYLQISKQQKKKLFPIWKQKFTLDPTLERLLYRTQLVDFSEITKFNESVSALITGLRNLFVKGDADLEESTPSEEESEAGENQEEEDDLEYQQLISQHYVFLSFDSSDVNVAEEVEAHFQSQGIPCILSNTPSSKLSSYIVHCSYFVFIISKKSMTPPSKVLDQVALAENHKKTLFPIITSKEYRLSPAMDYTLATVPKFFSQDGNQCFVQLMYVVRSLERIKAINIDAKGLEEKWQILEKKVVQKRKEIAQAKKAYLA